MTGNDVVANRPNSRRKSRITVPRSNYVHKRTRSRRLYVHIAALRHYTNRLFKKTAVVCFCLVRLVAPRGLTCATKLKIASQRRRLRRRIKRATVVLLSPTIRKTRVFPYTRRRRSNDGFSGRIFDSPSGTTRSADHTRFRIRRYSKLFHFMPANSSGKHNYTTVPRKSAVWYGKFVSFSDFEFPLRRYVKRVNDNNRCLL